MAKDYVLEIGLEEVPAKFIPDALKGMTEAAERLLQAYRLKYDRVKCYGTPRRFILTVANLSERQDDAVRESRGPAKRVAFDEEGRPTKAAEGFAKGQGVSVDALEIRQTEQGEYLYAVVREEGRDVKEVLPSLIKELIEGMSFPKSMRWGSNEGRFVRPIKWILSLYGSDTVEVEAFGIRSGRMTYGLRFLAPGPFEVGSAGQYPSVVREGMVIYDQDERRALIREGAEKLAKAHGGHVLIDDDLLDEITYLVEYPTPLLGRFREEYLELPVELVTTPMKEHQRYFPVVDSDGRLMNAFIAVRNGNDKNIGIVAEGNEKVLKARLEDAKFFYDEDKKIPLADYVERLKGILFHESLGSIYDKTLRVQRLACRIAELLGLDEETKKLISRCAYLIKADLATNVVYEFPELQGVMGREYARLSGEPDAVALGVFEHYLPRFAEDELPSSIVGSVAAIADKIDTVAGLFSAGIIPTGSQDPYALRRQILGVLSIIIENRLDVSLDGIISCSLHLFKEQGYLKREPDDVKKDILDFTRQRLRNSLIDRGSRYDIVDAVLAVGIERPAKIREKIAAIERISGQEGFAALTTAFTRASKIIAQSAAAADIDPNLFKEAAESSLYNEYLSAAKLLDSALEKDDYDAALSALAGMKGTIDAFFDNVMVMDKDERIRNNRLALLTAVVGLFRRMADLSQISG